MAKILLTIEANNTASASVATLNKQVAALSKTLSSITVNKDLTAQINALTKNYTAAVEAQIKLAQNTNREAAGIETTRKGYANLITTLKTLKSQYAEGVFGTLPEDAEKALREIENISAAYEKNGKLTEEQASALARLSRQLKKYSADLAVARARNDKIVAANPFTVTQAQQIPRLIKQYSTLLNTIGNTEKYYPKGTFDTFKTDLIQGQAELQALNQEFLTTGTLSEESQIKLNNLANTFNQLRAGVAQTTSTMKSSKGTLKDIVSGFAKFQLAAMLVMKPLQWIRSALTSLNETLVKTEDAVIALQRVLPTGSATDDDISSKVYDIAQRYGQTFENVSQIATNFARTGMSWADTIKATEAAVLALNVAELDATEASEGLISILTQFEMTADQLTEVVDKLNKAADKNPVTTEKLLTALQRTGAAAKNANITLDETIGIITTLSKATNRSGENLGTAVNSLIQFSSKESSLDTFAKFGGDVEVAVEKFRAGAGSILEIWQELGDVIKSRQSEAESILGGGLFNNEEWASLNDELKEALGESYADVTDIYNTASVFRRNYFVALLNDMDNVKKVTDDIADANGYSQAENEKALQTYTKRLNSLKAQWQDLANSEQGILGIKKALVDVGSALLTIIKWTGGLRTTLLGIATIVWILVGNKLLSGLAAIGTAIKGLITGLITAQKAAQRLQAALGWIGLIATAISLIAGIVQQSMDPAQSQDLEALSRASKGLSSLRDNVQQNIEHFDELKRSVEEARAVLADSTSTTEEIASAQNTLTTIQDTLTKSNLSYADSLDLTNGELAKQLDLIAQMGEENARKKVQEYLDANADVISDAREYQNKTSDWITFDEGAGVWDIELEPGYGKLYKWLSDNGYHVGRDQSFWKGLGSVFSNMDYAFTKVKFEGHTKEEQIQFLKDLLEQAPETPEDNNYIKSQISAALRAIEEDEKYISTRDLLNGSSNSWKVPIEVLEKFRDGVISYKQFLKEIGLLQEDVTTETGEWHNNIAKVTGKYDDLIDKLKELRDAQKESLDLEEKKKAVLEAQKALRDAQKEATVRRYNDKTGQWEWQTDEKKIAEAEKDLEKARQDLEDQAYDTIIDQLENKTATNEGIAKIINDVIPVLGEQFGETIREAFKQVTGVDISLPPYTPPADDGTYDNGGAAIGKGLMRKATDKTETVIGPDLTEQILSPVSNAHFDRWVRDMGLLFETSRQYAQTPVIERVGGNTDNSVNNSGQVIIKDVNVGAEQRDNLLGILALGGIVPNV